MCNYIIFDAKLRVEVHSVSSNKLFVDITVPISSIPVLLY